MGNAFNWQGKPSIFTTGKAAADFNGINTEKSERASASAVPNTITLPNSSLFPRPGRLGPQRGRFVDALLTGAELGKRK